MNTAILFAFAFASSDLLNGIAPLEHEADPPSSSSPSSTGSSGSTLDANRGAGGANGANDASGAGMHAGAVMTTTGAKPPLDDDVRLYAWPGTAFGPRFTDGGVGLGEISVSYRLNDWIEPEALAGFGFHGVDDLQVIDRFSFGSRFVLPVDELRPFLWVALHHEHQAQWDAVMKNPIGSTLGISAQGVAHYTGAEAGVGVAVVVPVEKNPFQAMVRVNVVYLPAMGGMVAGGLQMKDQLALMVDLAGGMPLRF